MVNRQQEIREAISAADNALTHLESARGLLQSAGNWGLMDMLGGGFLSTLIKRGKMSSAQEEMTAARTALRSFAKELRDVGDALHLDMPMDDFLSFADYFFDGMIADWMVQRRIGDAKRQTDEAIGRVSEIRAELSRMAE